MSFNPFVSRGRQRGLRRSIYILPNLFTTANLFCGFYSVISSLQMEFAQASWAILAAGIFDFLDGRVARLARAESEFGIEYDSLVDLTSFGMAPGILIYTWSLSGYHRLGWMVAFLYFACGALRLARFNVQIDNVEKNFFQGLPIPTGAYLIASTVIMHHFFYEGLLPQRNIAVLIMVACIALLMVSTIRYRSFKQLNLYVNRPFTALLLSIGILFVIAVEPEITIFLLVLVYALSGIVEELFTMRRSKAILERVRSRRHEKQKDLPRDDVFPDDHPFGGLH